MTNYWMLQALDGTEPVELYAATTDETIKLDLEAEPAGGSLIAFARHSFLRREFSDETNHFDQASGSLSYYCDTVKRYTRDNTGVISVESIPDGLDYSGLGGHSLAGYNQSAICIYERRPKK